MAEHLPLSALPLAPQSVGAFRTRIGRRLHEDAAHILPWTRSLTGPGVRQTLDWIAAQLGDLAITSIPTGEPIFDWVVPDEWSLQEAWIEGPDGSRIVDAADSNLHVVNYSEPVDKVLGRDELDSHLHSLPLIPDAVPYVTSYYKRRWGFCLADAVRKSLPEGDYRAVIRSTLEPGHLTYGEYVIPGESDEEILLTTYVCHPSMANNETSGIVVTTMLAQWLAVLPRRRYTYRILYCPETIGAVAFLTRRHDHLKEWLKAGFVITMVGDDRGYSYTETPRADTLADRIGRHVVNMMTNTPSIRPHTLRASDERQFCAPGIDLPVGCLMRAGRYPEYHTSEDNLDLVSPTGLYGGFELARLCLAALENNALPKWTVRGEPFLSRHGLRGTIGGVRALPEFQMIVSNILAFSDGTRDLVSIAEMLEMSLFQIYPVYEQLAQAGLLKDER